MTVQIIEETTENIVTTRRALVAGSEFMVQKLVWDGGYTEFLVYESLARDSRGFSLHSIQTHEFDKWWGRVETRFDDTQFPPATAQDWRTRHIAVNGYLDFKRKTAAAIAALVFPQLPT